MRIIHPSNLSPNIINNKIVFYKDVIKPSLVSDGDDREIKLGSQSFIKGKKGDVLKIRFDNFSAEHKLLVLIASLRAGYPRIKTVEQMMSGIESFDEIKRYLNLIYAPLGILADPVPIKAAECMGCSKSTSIIISIYQDGKTKEIEVSHPREKASIDLLDLSSHLTKNKGPLSFKLEWTNTHNLEPVGLAKLATKEEVARVKTETLKPTSVKHFQKSKFIDKDLKKEEIGLRPGQYLELTFPYKETPPKKGETVSFVAKSKGYYKKI